MNILIGGLLDSQHRHIQKDCPKNVELRFLSADQKSRWTSVGRNADYVIVMVDFLSHKHVQMVQVQRPDAIVLRGGLTHLKALIKQLSESSNA